MEKLNVYNEQEVLIEGRICSDYKFNNFGNITFTMDNLTFTNENESNKISGKIVVYVSGYKVVAQELQKGKFVRFLSKIDMNSFDKENMGYLSNGNIAIAECISDKITYLEKTHLTLQEKIRNFVYQKLDANSKYSSIAYAMIFGDSSYIEDNVKDVFRTGGIAHLLAVSGLHISILLSVQLFLMKKLKLGKKSILISSSIILLIYLYLCDFSISVVRASIMAMTSLLADFRGKPYDRLSSMSLAICLILLINPTKMFSYSFILSFSTVFAIILLSKIFERLFGKIFKSKFAKSLALCVSVELGISVVQCYLFGNFSILSLFSNLICVPIAVFAFVLELILLIISIILPFMSFALKIFDYLILIVIKFTSWISKLGLIINSNTINFGVVILLFVLFFIVSPYFNKKVFSKNKYIKN